MSEQAPPSGPDGLETDDERSTGADADPTTGVPAVDRVLGELDSLDELPLEEHLEVFERAHGSLRAALDAEPGDPA
jgi:hypothetical protein